MEEGTLPPTEVIAFAEPCFGDCHCASDLTASSSESSSEEPEWLRRWVIGISYWKRRLEGLEGSVVDSGLC